MLFTLFELADIVVMTLVIGYLFHDVFRKPVEATGDVLDHYRKKIHGPFGIEWNDFWWAAALAAPATILHEFGHKFVGLFMGLHSTFYAACSSTAVITGGFFSFPCVLTIIAVVMKMLGWGFIFFVPGFVATSGSGTHLQFALIAFAGPGINLALWLGSEYILRHKKLLRKLPKSRHIYLFFFSMINKVWFFFNMIPLGWVVSGQPVGFDGFSVLYHLFKIFF